MTPRSIASDCIAAPSPREGTIVRARRAIETSVGKAGHGSSRSFVGCGYEGRSSRVVSEAQGY